MTFKNQKAAATAMNIPLEWIKICINRAAPGCNQNGSINQEKLQQYIADNKKSIEDEMSDSIQFWKKENQKEDNAIKKLKKKELQRNIIEPNEVRLLLVSMATAQSAMGAGFVNEYAPKVSGKPEAECRILLEQFIHSFLKVIKDKEAKY